MKKCLSFLFLSTLLIYHPVQAQQLYFEHLGMDDGLPENSVLTVVQDSIGFMWFGTPNGLVKYDGHRMKVYQANPADSTSLSSDHITALLFDSQNNLWVGTSRGGLNLYDYKNDRFISLNTKNSNISHDFVRCIYEDRSGYLWVGTESGLNRMLDKQKDVFQQFVYSASKSGIANDKINTIYQDTHGLIWIGTEQGLSKLTIQEDHVGFENYYHQPKDPNSISDDFISVVMEDQNNRLWIGTNNGLNQYDPARDSFTRFEQMGYAPSALGSNVIREIMPINENELWIGTLNGLNILNTSTFHNTLHRHKPTDDKSLSKNSIYSLYQDKNLSVWIGTYFGGVNVTHHYRTPFSVIKNHPYKSGINNEVIGSMVIDHQDNLWIGTEGGGINYLNTKNGKVTHYVNDPKNSASLGSNLVKVIFKDQKNNLWVGTRGGGLNLFNPKTKTFKQYIYSDKSSPSTKTSEITSIEEDYLGRLWVGSQQGLYISDAGKKNFREYSYDRNGANLQNKHITVLMEDSKNNFWIGTSQGLYILKNSLSYVIPFHEDSKKHLTNSDWINCLFEDTTGIIWVGTNQGLNKCVPDKQNYKVYTINNNLPDKYVFSIQEDSENNLWLGTGKGLCKLERKTGSVRTYTTDDGIAGNRFNYNSSTANDQKNILYFGGFNGVTYFHPSNIEVNPVTLPLVFTYIKIKNSNTPGDRINKISNKNIIDSNSLTLKHNQSSFTIDYTLLNYVKPDKNRYQYKLEGYHNAWNITHNPSITLDNLPFGEYTLKVKGANNDGIWGEVRSLKIVILPPFWRTWWAYLTYIILFIAISFFITRYFYMRAILKKDRELHQAKLQFFTNISHEIRTHLSLILNPIENLKDISDKHQVNVNTVKRNAHNLMNLVNELMDFRRIETKNLKLHVCEVNLVNFLLGTLESFQDKFSKKNIQTYFLPEEDNIKVWIDPEQMKKVFVNLISNAVKFTQEDGTIQIIVSKNKKDIEIKIIDNGKGIDSRNLKNLFIPFYQEENIPKDNEGYGIGLALSKSIVELHKGLITTKSTTNKKLKKNKTCFTVHLPVGKEHFKTSEIVESRTEQSGFEKVNTNTSAWPEKDKHNKISRKQISILLVEDNQDVRKFISNSLKTSYHIIEADNGEKGLQASLKYIPDIIITDVMMPKMNGYELVENLKKNIKTNHIPIIFLTAANSLGHHIDSLDSGVDAFITKPFSLQVIRSQILNILKNREILAEKYKTTLHIASDGQYLNDNSGLSHKDKQFLEDIMQTIENELDNTKFSVTFLARALNMSSPVLYKKLDALTGMSVNNFIKSIRLHKAHALLENDGLRVSEVAYSVGFSDEKYFSKEFKKYYGKTPTEIKRKKLPSSLKETT